MENLLLLRMCQLRMRCYRWQGRENAYCSLPVEGQINQLKMIKHQMYSRAGLELLPDRSREFPNELRTQLADANPLRLTRRYSSKPYVLALSD